VTAGGKTRALPDGVVASLRGGDASDPLEKLHIDHWTHDARKSAGPRIDGVATDRISAKVDVVDALNDLSSLAGSTGGERVVPEVGGREATRLRDAVKRARLDLWSDKQDHLLRRLRVDVALGFDVPRTLRRALGHLIGAQLSLRMSLSRVNRRAP
jgi:hypothetical protein